MTFAKQLLQKLSDWRPKAECQHLEFQETGHPWKAHLHAECVDRIGLRLWEITLEPLEGVEGRADLKGWAESVTQRVTGLMEPLRLIEIDTLRRTAQLRSVSPTSDLGGEIAYYEILLQGNGGSTVRRYQTRISENGKRSQTAFSLTHEVFGKLVNDLTTL